MGSAATTKPPLSRGTGRIVEREHLLVRLLAARRLRCVVLTGPTGLGKTTLLSAWRQALAPLGYDPAWLALSAHDNEPERFFAGLVDSLAQVDPQIAADARVLDGSAGDADGAEHLMITLVRGIARHRREVVLVLDDVHHLAHPAIRDALQWLLDYAPANLHVALASRTAVRLSLERLRAQEQVLELGLQELRFTLAESEQFLRLQLGEVDRRSAKVLHELSDGWVAGLQLFAIEWKKKRPEPLPASAGDAFTRVPVRDARAFARFFDQEVFAHLRPAEAELLVALAPCSRFCAPLVVAMADPQGGVAEVLAMLGRLEAENLFVVMTGAAEGQGWYRVHPLLRELLLERFAAFDAERQRALHARAWAWFREHGHHDEAIRHAVSAGEAEQAADYVEQCAQSLFLRGERGALVSLVRQLPAAQAQARLGLRIWMMRAHLYLRELDACAKAIDALERDVPAGDAATRYLLLVHRAAMAVQRDDTDGALLLLPQLLDAPPDASVVVRGARNNILSWLYMHRDEYEAARQVQGDAPLMAGGRPFLCTAAGSLYGRCLVGLSHALEGQMTQAERLYRAALHESEQLGKGCADTAYFAAALLGDVLYEIDDTQAARRLLEERVDVLERVAIPDAVLRALRVLSAAHWLQGNRLESFAWLERLEDYALKHGLDRLLAHSLSIQIRQRLALGEHMAARACIERLDALDAKYPQPGSGVQAEIGELAQRMRIRWCVAQRDLDAAAVQLAALMAQCEARGRLRSIACLHLEAALIDMRRGHEAAARDKALAALRMGHRLGLLRSLLDVGSGVLRLLRSIAQAGAIDPVLGFYVERLESAHRAETGTPAAAATAVRQPADAALGAFSDREVDMLRLLVQAMPNKRIARALGLSPETVKWYLSRIYGKLRVGGRDEAVARVRDLGWIGELEARTPFQRS